MTTTTLNDPESRARSRRSSRGAIAAVILAAILGYGMWAWAYEVGNGLGVTDMRNVQIWGLYIMTFMFFVGASAGGMIVASVATIFKIHKVEHLARTAILISLVTIVIAGLLILPDLGQPGRFLELFYYAHWTSPMVWDVTIILVYAVFNIVYLWLHMRSDLAERHHWLALGTKNTPATLRRDHKLIVGGAYLALPLAVALHSITAWIVATQPSHPYWNSTLMAPWFVVSAIVSGIGLVVVVLLVLERMGRLSIGDAAHRWLTGFLATAIAVEVFFIAVEIITISASRVPGDWSALKQLMVGSYGWIFWCEIGTLLLGLALIVTPRGRADKRWSAAAAVAVIVSTMLMRGQLMVGGLRYPNLGYAPGISLGTGSQLTTGGSVASGVQPFLPTNSSFVQIAHYNPTWVEWSIVIGFCALWGLLVMAGLRFLPMLPSPGAADNPNFDLNPGSAEAPRSVGAPPVVSPAGLAQAARIEFEADRPPHGGPGYQDRPWK